MVYDPPDTDLTSLQSRVRWLAGSCAKGDDLWTDRLVRPIGLACRRAK